MTLWAIGLMAVAVFVVGGVIDYMSLSNQKHQLQGVADRAAIAAAQELTVFKGSDDRVMSVADAFVAANYTDTQEQTAARIVDGGKAVEVTIVAKSKTYFPGPVAQGTQAVTVTATAEISGGGYVCMMGLSPDEPSTLDMHNKARVTAENCAIYSNSRSSSSLKLHDAARVKADLVCVAGGVQGATSAVFPNPPVEDCPPLADPLRDRPMPKVGLLTCENLGNNIIKGSDLVDNSGRLLDLAQLLKKTIGKKPSEVLAAAKTLEIVRSSDMIDELAPGPVLTGTTTLEPGVYCGGINVIGGNVTLKPGVYVINNGGLNVAGGGSITGEGVGFFLTGDLGISTIKFAPMSTISLTAPRTGDMAGMLFFEDRNVLFKVPHKFSSNDARKLVGTIYLPGNTLTINSNNAIADQSDYTVIIARKFDMMDGPELVLNTDYESSLIPVPDGVGNKSRPIVKLTTRTPG